MFFLWNGLEHKLCPLGFISHVPSVSWQGPRFPSKVSSSYHTRDHTPNNQNLLEHEELMDMVLAALFDCFEKAHFIDLLSVLLREIRGWSGWKFYYLKKCVFTFIFYVFFIITIVKLFHA
jgi:hypothetical protein